MCIRDSLCFLIGMFNFDLRTTLIWLFFFDSYFPVMTQISSRIFSAIFCCRRTLFLKVNKPFFDNFINTPTFSAQASNTFLFPIFWGNLYFYNIRFLLSFLTPPSKIFCYTRTRLQYSMSRFKISNRQGYKYLYDQLCSDTCLCVRLVLSSLAFVWSHFIRLQKK